jgi:hypothetical protein
MLQASYFMGWDGMGRKFLKNRPIPWDENFFVIVSHGMGFR